METSKVAAVILAAGTSSRFRAAAGANGPATKLTTDLNGKPLVRRVAEAALRSHARPVIVVTGYADAAVHDALEGLPLNFVYNDAFETGMASSIIRGLS
jgi:molybdenum cofactor cytidylyltransferase